MKSFIVTGSSSGIGLSITLELLKKGFNVMGIDLNNPNKEVLKVYSGTKSVGLFGLTWRRPWINQTNFEINPRQIVYLKKI